MSAAVADLLAAARKLSPEEQGELADRLYEQLLPPDPALDLSDAEYEAEVEQLADELGLQPGVDLTWEQVRELR